MVIYIDPTADIIQQLNDLNLILAVKEVNVVVSQEQLEAVKSNIHGSSYGGAKDIPSNIFPIRIGAVQFNLTTPPTSTRPDVASSEGHTDK